MEVGQEHELFSDWQVRLNPNHPRHKFRTLGRVTRDQYSPESFLLREPARSALRGTVFLIRQAVKQSTEWVRWHDFTHGIALPSTLRSDERCPSVFSQEKASKAGPGKEAK